MRLILIFIEFQHRKFVCPCVLDVIGPILSTSSGEGVGAAVPEGPAGGSGGVLERDAADGEGRSVELSDEGEQQHEEVISSQLVRRLPSPLHFPFFRFFDSPISPTSPSFFCFSATAEDEAVGSAEGCVGEPFLSAAPFFLSSTRGPCRAVFLPLSATFSLSLSPSPFSSFPIFPSTSSTETPFP